jgi:ankyrin repeat protein
MHWLLWQSADMDAQTPKGWTPAHIASIRGHDPCIQVRAILSIGFYYYKNMCFLGLD